ncbi:hypothetical protein F8388_021236 [Cannabis sativa]|uniref:Uncharacterized protein n=1 Tax=Cannabis sativa TaxID=3483 RepID=A0A7J6GFI4_CANSA|nr:hypothetical protein F8388_021236 [Cannabis sativa]
MISEAAPLIYQQGQPEPITSTILISLGFSCKHVTSPVSRARESFISSLSRIFNAFLSSSSASLNVVVVSFSCSSDNEMAWLVMLSSPFNTVLGISTISSSTLKSLSSFFKYVSSPPSFANESFTSLSRIPSSLVLSCSVFLTASVAIGSGSFVSNADDNTSSTCSVEIGHVTSSSPTARVMQCRDSRSLMTSLFAITTSSDVVLILSLVISEYHKAPMYGQLPFARTHLLGLVQSSITPSTSVQISGEGESDCTSILHAKLFPSRKEPLLSVSVETKKVCTSLATSVTKHFSSEAISKLLTSSSILGSSSFKLVSLRSSITPSTSVQISDKGESDCTSTSTLVAKLFSSRATTKFSASSLVGFSVSSSLASSNSASFFIVIILLSSSSSTALVDNDSSTLVSSFKLPKHGNIMQKLKEEVPNMYYHNLCFALAISPSLMTEAIVAESPPKPAWLISEITFNLLVSLSSWFVSWHGVPETSLCFSSVISASRSPTSSATNEFGSSTRQRSGLLASSLQTMGAEGAVKKLPSSKFPKQSAKVGREKRIY